MLRFLSIRNLAIIDELEIEFDRGLTVLPGETGAGKSILVGAVGLLVGGRAAGDLVRSGKDTASIEAVFETADGREVIVRREISAQGRSRAFVDGALATSGALRDLSRSLVDLHGQHDHQVLLDPSSHLDVLDAYVGADEDRGLVAGAFAAWQQTRAERDRLVTNQRERASRSEFIAFQLAEIDRVAPKPGEDEELAATRRCSPTETSSRSFVQ
jgi:DNA repair protein RecN (Recombination protein N)